MKKSIALLLATALVVALFAGCTGTTVVIGECTCPCVTEGDNTPTENTTETTEQAATPATQASKPAVPSPAAMKPHAPSPAAFAKKTPKRAPATTGFSEEDVKAAETFGRVADDGTVFVKDGEGEREVGQFPDASKEEALALYARRYLDLKAKLDTVKLNIEARVGDEGQLFGSVTTQMIADALAATAEEEQ